MKRIKSFLAIAFPWAILLIHDDPVGAFIALIMQVTIIGWIPASIWAWRIAHKKKKKKNKPEEAKTTLEPKQE